MLFCYRIAYWIAYWIAYYIAHCIATRAKLQYKHVCAFNFDVVQKTDEVWVIELRENASFAVMLREGSCEEDFDSNIFVATINTASVHMGEAANTKKVVDMSDIQ